MRLSAAITLFLAASVQADSWPSFRGPSASGVADSHETLAKWTADSGVLWSTPVPGLGLSSPVVASGRLFVTTAVRKDGESKLLTGLYGDIAPVDDDSEHGFRLICLDAKTGKTVWDELALESKPKVRRHPKSSHANSTPATDGRHVLAFFGSEGLYCYTVEGKLVWKKDLGVLDSGYFRAPGAQWGFGSSPIIHDGRVIVQCDVQKNSFLAAFALEDGKELWRTPRDDVPTWSTPTVIGAGDAARIVVNGFRHAGAYRLKDGREVWRLERNGDIPVPTPVAGGDLVFLTSAHGRLAPIYAVRAAKARGNISLPKDETRSDAIAWSVERGGNYMQTPLVYGEFLYMCRDTGVLSCYEVATGERAYRKRLGEGRSGFTASLVAARGKIYATSEDGDVYVVKAGSEFELLATNSFDAQCMATPAIADGVIYFRTRKGIVAVGTPAEK